MYYRFETASTPASSPAQAGSAAAGLLLEEEAPPLCDVTAYLAGLPPATAAELRLRRRVSTRFWEEHAPPGRTAERTELSFLAAPWQGFAPGTLVLTRSYPEGAEHLVIADSVFDPGLNDVTVPGVPEPGDALLFAESAGLAAASSTDDEVVRTVVGSALTMLEFALFAAGPYGLVGAGAVAVLHTLFDRFYPDTSEGPTEAEVLLRSIEAQFQAQDVRHAANGVATYVAWFNKEYRTDWPDTEPTDAKYLEEFIRYLHGAFSPEGSVLKALTLMSSPAYRHIGLNTYILAASVLALLRKTAILLDSTEKPLCKSSYLPPFVTELAETATHSRRAYDEIRTAIANRMAQIGAPEPFEDWEVTYAGQHRYTGWRFVDRGAPAGQQEYRYRLYSLCCKQWGGEPDCRQAHAGYVAAVQRDNVAKYNFYSPEKMERTIAKLEEAHATYARILKEQLAA